MKKAWIFIGVALLIGAMIGATIWKGASATSEVIVEITQLESEDLSSTVFIPGTLALKNDQHVYPSPEKGELNEILVEVGDKVEVGTVLFSYTNEQLEMELEQNLRNQEST